jgi:hypothetical protein
MIPSSHESMTEKLKAVYPLVFNKHQHMHIGILKTQDSSPVAHIKSSYLFFTSWRTFRIPSSCMTTRMQKCRPLLVKHMIQARGS